MAMNWGHRMWIDDPQEKEEIHHAIQGKAFAVSYELSEIQSMAHTFTDDEIKKELLMKLLNQMMKSNHIEFTKSHDMITGKFVYRARIFAVPDTNVRILREKKVI